MDDPIKVVFLPGAFDNFDGTQEELDEMIAEITKMAENGSLYDDSNYVSGEDLDELPPEVLAQIESFFEAMEKGEDPTSVTKKKLN